MSRRFWGTTRRTLRWIRRLILALLLPLLLLAAFGQWWLLPRLNDYREELANALGDYLHVPVQIKAVAAVRDGGQLGLRLRGVSLHDPGSGATVVSFTQATVTLHLWRSLREWRPVLKRIRLEGANLTLEQGRDGTPRLLADANAADSSPSLPEVARWLFSLPRLEIVGERLTMRRDDNITLQLLHPYLQLQQTAQSQRLAFTAELPAPHGNQLQLTVERPKSELADAEPEQGTFELRADRLSLADWPLPLIFTAGQATLELRGAWRDWQPTQWTGRLQLQRAALTSEPRSALLRSWLEKQPDGELLLNWQQQETGWQLQGHTQFSDGKRQVVAQPTFELTQTGDQWQGHIHELRAQDVLAWVTPWLDERARRWLVPLDLHGALPEITVQTDTTGHYTATASFRDLTCRTTHGLPGFSNLTGTLAFTPEQGRIELDSRAIQVNTNGLLRAPITLNTLTGAVNWQRSTDGLELESAGLDIANTDLNGRFWGRITVPDAGKPLLDVQGHYHNVKVEAARRYLPVAVIPPPAVAWLDRALIGGRVSTGDFKFRGLPADFPFDKGDGLFATRFQIENAVLDYASGWPRLEPLHTTVTFRNRSLQVDASGGRLLDAELESVIARIDDLATPVVQVKGRTKGPSASMWRVLQDSPVGRGLGEDLPDLRLSGANTLDLELTIPLDRRPNQVRGRVGLLENTVTLPTWAIELGRVRGEVQFTEADLTAKNLQALLRGEAIQLDLDLARREGRRVLQARLQGRLGLRALVGEPAAALEPYVTGKSAWDATLTVPTNHREQRNETPAFTLDLNTDLRGVAVRLPAPLGKPPGESRSLKLSLHPQERNGLNLVLEYGSAVRAALELGAFPQDLQFKRGELRLNAGNAKLPDAPGLAVIAHLPRWEWSMPPPTSDAAGNKPAKSRTALTDTKVRTANPLSRLRSLNAQIGELIIGGQAFPEVTLQGARQGDGLQIALDSQALAGRVIWPDAPTVQQPVTIALQRLRVRRATDHTSSDAKITSPDPRGLPPLALSADELHLNDKTLGRLRLVAIPYAEGIRLPEIILNSEQHQISGNGEWRAGNGGPASQLQATLRSPALGETLAAFGYPDIRVARGETQAEIKVKWAAALPDFALERLDGTLKFRIGSGQLLNFNPGLGRIVGLLSVQNLTRRLSFDFSDLFQPGMGFDRITGEFTFEHGQAYTNNVTIEAPAARIGVQGRTGLKEHDYDQQITVTPRLSGTLPVAGAIAGGPAVGAAVFVAERLLQRDIERATRYRYNLTGSWDHPIITPTTEQPSTAAPKGFVSEN
ncbi:MAG: YhdP family protein [Candidatus Competibacteraceae bacterium]